MRYGQFCPIAKATEILGEKWTILIVRALLMGARRFSEDVLGTLAAVLAATAVLCALFAPLIVTLLAPGFDAESYLYAVYFLRLATPYLAIVGMVAVMAATLNAAGQVGAAAFSSPDAVVHVDRVYLPVLQPRVVPRRVDLVLEDGRSVAVMRDGSYGDLFGH